LGNVDEDVAVRLHDLARLSFSGYMPGGKFFRQYSAVSAIRTLTRMSQQQLPSMLKSLISALKDARETERTAKEHTEAMRKANESLIGALKESREAEREVKEIADALQRANESLQEKAKALEREQKEMQGLLEGEWNVVNHNGGADLTASIVACDTDGQKK
jgi:DNA repair exonuclease SbcCD ATPase subunit